ncbi:hypothetical protein AN401_07080 [Zobellella denitrificans]|uniref:ANR family transcriptional regulator n=1 Tax=Zobellella denitrificans TaxID=347534 RepID=A0A291HNA7_9GAMM|nr:ANR family transcriptional regulator [Zobellella denitrificans]ATG73647.1 hypothetical protein AN401_07080 [Zobellella denitrificans]
MISQAKKAKYQECAEAAAELERQRCWGTAAEAWEEAFYHATSPVNREWCKRRQQFCLRAPRWDQHREAA